MQKKAVKAKAKGSRLITLLAVIMLAVGLSFVGFFAWEFWGTGLVTRKVVDQEKQELELQWNEPVDAAPPPGEGRAQATWLLRIPKFGADYEWPIVDGIEVDDLKKGVGWFPTSALPGEIGNFALAGHRVTNGEPFRRLLELDADDEVIVETRDAIFTYRMTTSPRDLTVNFSESWVVDPVPGEPGVAPTEALITLTTCQSVFRTPDRSVGFGVLENVEAKT